jgi:hypothetical protein
LHFAIINLQLATGGLQIANRELQIGAKPDEDKSK